MIEIISRRFKEDWHAHKCPRCKKISCEPNTVCGKTSGDHVFICLICLQDYRLRLGTDMLLDSYLDQNQLGHLQEVAPDEKSDVLDQLDAFRRQKQLEVLAERAKAIPPAAPVTPQQQAAATHEEIEKLREEADVITYDEVVAETERLKKEEEI